MADAAPILKGNAKNRLQLVSGTECEIEGPELGPSIGPGDYLAYCRRAHVYRDPMYKRWVCLLVFDVLDGEQNTLGTAPMFLNMGDAEKPKATRRGRFLTEWCRANGGPPKRGDRYSMRVFTRRMVRVRVTQSKGPLKASKATEILSWETGLSGRN
jgi:hypothetical protein